MENELVNSINKEVTLDSREVAEMVGKRHDNLVRDIETYSKQMEEANKTILKTYSKLRMSDYFVKSTYLGGNGEERPCYKITKIGCEFISNKLTGVKGTAFTAIYTKRFNEMESNDPNSNSSMITVVESQLTSLVNNLVSEKLNEIEEKCSQYYRPVSKEKQNIVSYIKRRLGINKANEEYELVKERVLIKLGGTKWEDIPVETLVDSLNIIDESIRIIKADRKFNQVSLWD
ncbi:Rha family transcriptional regulator [Clostridium felsineum]|uniref:Rha family transcriptional regulator n=1 Tax=Clostridium felsineum TaxID=36839 RepID=UPI00214DD348|nr:Rha family transcriptional regulator [Clostridium felsineum]MCR3758449.1 Rha family transcriptional regulator [Clostridium felsineum]